MKHDFAADFCNKCSEDKAKENPIVKVKACCGHVINVCQDCFDQAKHEKCYACLNAGKIDIRAEEKKWEDDYRDQEYETWDDWYWEEVERDRETGYNYEDELFYDSSLYLD